MDKMVGYSMNETQSYERKERKKFVHISTHKFKYEEEENTFVVDQSNFKINQNIENVHHNF